MADIVARRAAADAAGGNANAKRCLALIDRKMVKQTVMTSVYGVTTVGARSQVGHKGCRWRFQAVKLMTSCV